MSQEQDKPSNLEGFLWLKITHGKPGTQLTINNQAFCEKGYICSPFFSIMPFYCIDLGDSSNRPTRINPHEAKETFDILRPKMSPFPLVRIGGAGDGAYLLPDDLAGISGCLSPGVNNYKPFEDELSVKYGIRSDLFDASSSEERFSTPLIEGMQTFEPKWLAIIPDKDSITINEWLAMKTYLDSEFLLLNSIVFSPHSPSPVFFTR